MVFSSVGLGGGTVLLEKTLLLLSFHHFNSTYNNKKKEVLKGRLLVTPPVSSSRHHQHISSVGLQQSLQSTTQKKNGNGPFIFCCSTNTTTTTTDDSSADNFSTSSSTAATATTTTTTTSTAPLIRKRKRYRKQYPGENEGIVEEMRFVAMKLRNSNSTKNNNNNNNVDGDGEEESSEAGDDQGVTWQPSIEGFLKYLVNSKLVFQTLERVVYESDHVAYTYFRKTGLERSEGLAKDLEWFRQQNLVIPEPSNPGVSYAEYLEELAEKSAPSFLCHFYNIYFAHISGGQVIAKQVSEKLLEGRELEFYRWEGDAPELLKDVRENLNKLGEHWSRDEKNKCLREAAKSFRFLGQIVRLIIL
ncbi:heme oxygenase-like [Macleaya cordata]|uniref:heme oxygenase (biliverdin-producing) n=1 Tax=Macleaya cordata TaxID=56857 RepID=A0A200PNN1_MACCD|nr:heme oxygenase-like [Macleaya cordata]